MAAGMPRAAVHSQLASAVDAVVHVVRGPDGVRRVAQIGVLDRDGSGMVSAAPAVTFTADGVTLEHPAAELLGRRLNR